MEKERRKYVSREQIEVERPFAGKKEMVCYSLCLRSMEWLGTSWGGSDIPSSDTTGGTTFTTKTLPTVCPSIHPPIHPTVVTICLLWDRYLIIFIVNENNLCAMTFLSFYTCLIWSSCLGIELLGPYVPRYLAGQRPHYWAKWTKEDP